MADVVEFLVDLVDEIAEERWRQQDRWSDCEHLPDGTRNGGMRVHQLEMARLSCDRAYREGVLTHAHVFEEEAMEVLAEENPQKLRVELVQVMAVCAKWIADIDSRPR